MGTLALVGAAAVLGVGAPVAGEGAPTVPSTASLPPPADAVPTADTLSTPGLPGFVLAPIVVTAHRELAVPPPVVTRAVDRDLLIRTPADNPWQTLGRTAHLEVHDPGQGPGLAPNAVLRGFASDHSSEVLLVVDGVPVNLPVHGHAEGYSEWNVLFPAAIRTFRIIHGPSSPLYGDYALSGTVEVFTQADHEGTAVGTSVSSYGDVDSWALTGFRGDASGALAGAQLRRNEGWRDNSDFILTNALLRGWRQMGESRIEGGLAIYASRWSSPGYLPRLWFTERRLSEAIDPSDGGEQGRGVLQGRLARPLGGDRYLQVHAWSLFSDWENYAHVPGHGDEQRGELDRRAAAGLQVEGHWTPPDRGELTLGIEVAHHASRYELLFTQERETLHSDARIAAARTVGAGYVRWRRVIGERLGLDVGTRVDLLRTATEDRRPDAPPDPANGGFEHDIRIVEGSATAVVLSPKAGVRLLASDHTALLVSLARGVRSAQGVMGDPERAPVQAWTGEVGIEHDAGWIRGDLSLFRTHVSNERIRDPLTTLVSSAGRSVRQGVEGRIGWTPAAELRIEAGAAYTHSRLDGAFFDPHGDHGADPLRLSSAAALPQGAAATASSEGPIDPSELRPSSHVALPESEWVPGIQLWRSFVQAEWLTGDRLSLRGDVRVHGPYVPVGEPYHETDPYTLVGAGATIRMGDRWLLDLDGANLLDQVYPAVRASGFVVPGNPRTLRIGVRRGSR